jgi:hypothetical protein
VEMAKPIIERYGQNSVYTISNVEGVRFDSETKRIVADWVEHNKPYVIKGAVVGVDGIRKIFINTIFAMTGRKNMIFVATREKAIGLLLKRN